MVHVYKTYQLSYSLFSILNAGLILMLPVIYLLDGYYLSILYLAGICWLSRGSLSSFLVLLLFPYYRNRLRRRESCWQLSLCFFFWFLYAAARYMPEAACFAWILVLLVYITIEDPPLYRKLARWILYALLFLKALYYHFFFDIAELFTDVSSAQWPKAFGRTELLLLALCIAVGVRIYLIYIRKGRIAALDSVSAAAAGILLSADIFFCSGASNTSYELLVNTGLIAFSLIRLLIEGKQKNLSSVRRYTAAIVLYIVMKVSSGAYPLLTKGVFFLIAGIAFLAANYIMTRKLKGEISDDRTSE